MTDKIAAPFGSWKSPVNASNVSSASVGIGNLRTDGENLYWLETRPAEGGRTVIVERAPDSTTRDITPPRFNARTRVHEYGGIAYAVAGGTVWFSNFTDQRVYEQKKGGEPRALTPDAGVRYADFAIDKGRGRLIAVREDHRLGGEAISTIVSIDLESGGEGTVLFEGTDFVSSPRLSPDGTRLAWISWNHPDMPWDETDLHVAAFTSTGEISQIQTLRQPRPGAISQSQWSPDGTLYFIADWTDWWNLYRWEDGEGIQVHDKEAEFATPSWSFGMSNYVITSNREALVSYTSGGAWYLGRLDLESGQLDQIGGAWSNLRNFTFDWETTFFIAETSQTSSQIYSLNGKTLTSVRGTEANELSAQDISVPEALSFPTADGETAHGFYYPPANKYFKGPEGASPPLIVKVHGGPTSAALSSFSEKIQYWTSRGFAVFDLNHRGSTGFGRAFRQRLYKSWGLVDVEDATHGARYLAKTGRADQSKLAITGGSAGGFTVLSALAFHDTFTAGASHFGVSDLEALAKDTHKFESRYLDSMIGPYPQDIKIYKERSPINAVDAITAPLIILQGLEDEVVPPAQSEMIYEALKRRGIPVAYLPFEGEQHGFRQAINIERALEAELLFYGRAFGFEPADKIAPFAIDNEKGFKSGL